MRAGDLDRRVQFRRDFGSVGPLGQTEDWQDHGTPIWARRRDMSDRDRETAIAGSIYAEIASRFVVRSTQFTRNITAKDRLVEGGREFRITGIKEIGRCDGLEITAIARVDHGT
ncbi:head-tail adaptor protein [Paracoccus alkanivorans]|uniref:Head-tail adaptor protein n=1 Tax=Paracoccus alkanivorans TaxID=2116655 RepID=A0A3M0MIS7_9RHOB|nr:head-tail adaptor protein [Paracoccus alkanivorans]RMC37499.1 head-tail adaptor protein [Paracoccus alkanivorans]